MTTSDARKRHEERRMDQVRLCDVDLNETVTVQGLPEPVATQTLRVSVMVDSDEVRDWAGKLADRGAHGPAQVLYDAAHAIEAGRYPAAALLDELERLRAVVAQVESYAREREAYGKRARTVYSSRVATDLLAITATGDPS